MANITKRNRNEDPLKPVKAADDVWGDPEDGDIEEPVTEEETDGTAEAIDDLADNVEDLQDQVDEVVEDDPSIDTYNNIEEHYIAECDRCHGIFISAVIKSDQQVDKITGICPLCEHESDQFLKWVITPVENK